MLNFEVPDIFVKDYRNEFGGRQETLFNALEAAEKEHGKNIVVKNPKARPGFDAKECRSITKTFRGKESIFKTPADPPSRIKLNRIIKANRSKAKNGKWTKYSLEDVDDMSEISNKRAAFSFLQEMQDRKRSANDDEEEKCLDGFKPVFKKPNCEASTTRATVQSKMKPKLPKVSDTDEKTSSLDTSSADRPRITLNHLSFDEEDE